MFSRIAKVSLVALWAVSMAWLIRYEAYPEYFEETIGGYRGLFGDELGIREQWMRVFFAGIPLGYTQTTLDMDETSPDTQYKLITNVFLRLPGLPGGGQNFRLSGEVHFDGSYRIQAFSVLASSGKIRFIGRGKRAEKDGFDIEYGMADALTHGRIQIPDDVVVQAPQFDLTMRRLQPGQQRWMKVLNPLTMTPERIRITAKGYESLRLFDGKESEALRVEISQSSGDVQAWLGRDGQMLRQETPFGLTLEACAPHEALSRDESAESFQIPSLLQKDLLNIFSP